MRDAEKKNLVADEKYLKILGFTDKPRLYPNDTWHNTSLPVVVTYVFDGQESQAIGLISNIGKILTNNTLLVYNLGLGTYSLQTVGFIKIKHSTIYCNILKFILVVELLQQ